MVASGEIENRECCCLLPLSFMNHSGKSVKQMISKKNITLENILIVCDDFNLDFGSMRIKPQGSAGGHNGLTSVVEQLQSSEFARLRLGIGAPADREDVVNYVLGKFPPNQRKQLPEILNDAVDCCTAWVTQPIEKVMSQFNKRTANG